MFQQKDLPVTFASGIYELKELVGTGGMAAVYSADVDLEKFDYATLIAHSEARVGDSREQRVRRREERRARWAERPTAELRGIADNYGLPYPRDGKAAVKVLLPHLANEVVRFRAEWESMIALYHPNLVKVFAGGEDEEHGMHYYSMELLAGILEPRELSLTEQVDIIRQSAEGLQALHDKGLIHRDIKPANIVATRTAAGQIHARVTDLGIAKDVTRTMELTMTNSVMGTPSYMAPEQADSARQVSHRSDIYALGATLYFWCSGRVPYEGLSLYVVLAKLATGDPPEPFGSLVPKGTPPGLITLVDRMMATEPTARPDSMATVAEALTLIDDAGAVEELLGPVQDLSAAQPARQLPDVVVVGSSPSSPVVSGSDLPTLKARTASDPGGGHQAQAPTLVAGQPSAPASQAADPPEPEQRRAPLPLGAIVGALIVVLVAVLGIMQPWRPAPGPADSGGTSSGSIDATVSSASVTSSKDTSSARTAAFETQLAAAAAQALKLIKQDDFDVAIAAFRELEVLASELNRSEEVRGRVRLIEQQRASRLRELEAAIERALKASSASAAPLVTQLARADRHHHKLATYRKRLTLKVAEEKRAARLAASVAALVAEIEKALARDPASATALLDQLASKAPQHPRLEALRDAHRKAMAKLSVGQQERAAAAAAAQAWQTELATWPAPLRERFALAEPEQIAKARQQTKAAEALLAAGKRQAAADAFEQAASGYRQGLTTFQATADKAASEAHRQLLSASKLWAEVSAKLALKTPQELKLAANAPVKTAFWLEQKQRVKVLELCATAEPKLSAATTEALRGALANCEALSEAWKELALERAITSPPASIGQAEASLAKARAAKQPLAQLAHCVAALEAFRKAIAKATYVPPDLPFKLPKGWHYLRRNAQDLHEVRSMPDRAVMIWIPKGRFTQGGCDAKALAKRHGTREAEFSDELPAHEVQLSGYFINKYETTCASFALFIKAKPEWRPGGASASRYRGYLKGWTDGRPPAGRERHPVVGVPYAAAVAFASWAQKRLPTEAEWERAARGGNSRQFPWGKAFDDSRKHCNSASYWTGQLIISPGLQRLRFLNGVWADKNKATLTMPVGSFPAGVSPFGLHDMAGNAMEWCLDTYANDFYTQVKRTPRVNPRNTASGSLRSVRGGSWMDPIGSLRTTHRQGVLQSLCDEQLGFRCAKPGE